MPGPSKARIVPLDCLSCLRVAERIKPSFCRINFRIFFSFSGLHGGIWSNRMKRYAGTAGSGPRNTFAPIVFRFMLLTWSKSKVVSSSLSPSEKVNSVWQCVYKKSYKKQHYTVHWVTAIVWQTLRSSTFWPPQMELLLQDGKWIVFSIWHFHLHENSLHVYKHSSLYICCSSFIHYSYTLWLHIL